MVSHVLFKRNLNDKALTIAAKRGVHCDNELSEGTCFVENDSHT